MPVNIHIHGKTAADTLQELKEFSQGLHLHGQIPPPPLDELPKESVTSPAEIEAEKEQARKDKEEAEKEVAAAKEEVAKQKAAKKKPAKKAAEPKPEPEPDPAPAPKDEGAPGRDEDEDEDEEITVDDVKRAVREFLSAFDNNADGQKEAQLLLGQHFGVKKVGDLPEGDFAEAIKLFETEAQERSGN